MRLAILWVLLLAAPSWGAELLVFTGEPGPDALHNQKGDVVAVREDGFDFGKRAVPPMWHIVKWPGVKVEDVKYLEEQLMEKVVVTKNVLVRQDKINNDGIESAGLKNAEIIQPFYNLTEEEVKSFAAEGELKVTDSAPLAGDYYLVRGDEEQIKTVRDRKYKLPAVLLDEKKFDEKGVMTAKIEDIPGQEAAIVAKTLIEEKTAISAEEITK